MGYDTGMRTINYVTEYDNETISAHGPGYISYETDDMFGEEDLPTLSADGMIFEGWYTTSTYDDGTKVNVGDVYTGTSAVITLYAKWSTPTVSSLLTNLADELRTLTNTTDKMGLSVMAGHVSDANTEVDEQSAVVDELMAALQGKSVPGGGGGVEYEVVTIPAGATSATYALPRVTHAYGSREPADLTYNSKTSDEQIIFSIHGTRVIYLDDVDGHPANPNAYAIMELLCDLVEYNAGTITWWNGVIDTPLTLLLVNDPSADAIST